MKDCFIQMKSDISVWLNDFILTFVERGFDVTFTLQQQFKEIITFFLDIHLNLIWRILFSLAKSKKQRSKKLFTTFVRGGEQMIEACLGSTALALFAARLGDKPHWELSMGVFQGHPQTFNIRAWLERKAARVFRGRSCTKRPCTPQGSGHFS